MRILGLALLLVAISGCVYDEGRRGEGEYSRGGDRDVRSDRRYEPRDEGRRDEQSNRDGRANEEMNGQRGERREQR